MGLLKKIFNNYNKEKDEIDLINDLPWGWLTENQSYISKKDKEFGDLFYLAMANSKNYDDEIYNLKKAIEYYYNYKEECKNKGKYFYQYFENQHMHVNESEENPTGIEEVKLLEDRLLYIQKNKEEIINKYNQKEERFQKYLKYKDPNEDNVIRTEVKDFNYNYIKIDDRYSVYSNSTNTYISTAGKKCIYYEQTLLNRIQNYNDSTCPYCYKKIILPQCAKKCEFCNNRIHVITNSIQQEKMLLTEDEHLKLKELKDIFYNDRNFNPNYKSNIFCKVSSNYLD